MLWLVNTIVNAVVFLGHWFWDRVLQLGYWAWVHVWQALTDVVSWAVGFVPEAWQPFLTQNPFQTEVWDAAEKVNWFIPWKLIVGIWLFSLVVIGFLRLARWVLGLEILGFSVRA